MSVGIDDVDTDRDTDDYTVRAAGPGPFGAVAGATGLRRDEDPDFHAVRLTLGYRF